MYNYNFIDHTADISIFSEADSIENLFIAFAEAYKYAVTGNLEINTVRRKEETSSISRFSIESDSLENLLVEFLNELNYTLTTKLLLFNEISLSLETKSPDSFFLHVDIAFFAVLSSDIVTEIKAVTYHELKIFENNGIFSATLIFDV